VFPRVSFVISLLERYPYLCGMTSRSGAPCSGVSGLAVHAHREQRPRVEQVLHAHAIEVAVGAVDADPGRLELRPRELEQLTAAEALPEHAPRPALHAFEAAALGDVRETGEVATFRRCGSATMPPIVSSQALGSGGAMGLNAITFR
jgi:hypothetical protein